jgi:RNA binding exosome subunit
LSFKEKMMESMMGNMSAAEKSAMMDKMMEQFFNNMNAEEKQDMMKNMMPKMMGQMMGEGSSMMSMMSSMMGGDSEGEGMGMCEKMMNSMNQSRELATFATPEIRGLFEEWVLQLDNEVIELIKKTKSTSPEEVANHLKISKDSAVYIISRLAQKGILSVTVKYEGGQQ